MEERNDRESVTRRSVLRGIGGGVFAAPFVGEMPEREEDRYVVGTDRSGVDPAKRAADRVYHVLDFGGTGMAVAGRFPKKAREALERRPDVRYVEPDYRAQAVGQTLPWGVDRVDADVAHGEGHTGDGSDVAILDTGIDADHPDLQANLGEGYAVVSCDNDYVNCQTSWDDDNGHGTHCAGIAGAIDNTEGVIGVAPDTTLHAVKVLNEYGSGYYSDIAAGLEWTADQGYGVASMSLGGTSGSSTLQDACDYAYSNGVVLVAAAGNDGDCTDCVLYPAKYSTVIAVSSTNENDGLSYFSSTGPEVELAAPGSSIYSTEVDGTYGYKSGTSMACPHVSGTAGILRAQGYGHKEARQRLRDTAENIGLSENEQGYGLVDTEAAAKTSSDTSVAVSTDAASSVGQTGATLNGNLDDLGGASSADVYFEWRRTGSDTWNATATQTLSATGSFSDSISGLEDGVDYEYRAVANASDGDSDAGSIVTFTTTNDPPAVSTDSPNDVTETSATLNGTLSDLGGAESVDVYFEYRETGATSWSATSAQTLSATGSFSDTVDSLSAGTEYEYRARATASDGDTDTASTVTFTTSGDTSVAVTTDGASSITAHGATLEGSLTDLGGASSADVYFEYRVFGNSTWSTTAVQTLSAAQTFSADVSGLAEETEYEFRAVAEASDGDTDTGGALTFTTTNDPPAVSTDQATDVTEDSATLNGMLSDLGAADSADIYFEWRPAGTDSYNTTTVSTLTATGSFSETITGLSNSTDYEYRARAEASDGDADTGSLVGFTTDSGSTGDNAPAIDTYTVSERGSPNPHAEITADWVVSDVDGDLATVTVEVFDSTGTLVRSNQTTVSGSNASGTDEFRIKRARNQTFDVRLTCVDSRSNTTTATRTVSE